MPTLTSLNSDQSEFSDISFDSSYKLNNFYFAANAEQSIIKAADGSEVTTDRLDLGITYTMELVTYGTGYAIQDNGTDKQDRFLMGAYIDLGSNNDCYIELGLLNKAAGDNDNLAMGYRITF
jgi:predicted porin